MNIKGQIKKVKENWFIILILIILFALFSFWGKGPATKFIEPSFGAIGIESAASAPYARGMIAPIMPDKDFAPEVTERKITKTASISNEVERGTFKEAENELKSVIKASDSFLLNENVNKIGKDRKSYYMGNYEIKTEASKYDSIISQLREIGEITSFNENSLDVTGSFKNLEIELGIEKERLARYKKLYQEATKVEDKINLEDRIFNQERMIKYLEDALKRIDRIVEYSTIYVTLTEKQSEYADALLVKLSELVRQFVSSVNEVLRLIFWAVPYLIAILIVWLVVRFFRKRK